MGDCEEAETVQISRHKGWIKRFEEFRKHLLHEMTAVGDDTLHGNNAATLQTLDQILDFERKEVELLEVLAADSDGVTLRSGKRAQSRTKSKAAAKRGKTVTPAIGKRGRRAASAPFKVQEARSTNFRSPAFSSV